MKLSIALLALVSSAAALTVAPPALPDAWSYSDARPSEIEVLVSVNEQRTAELEAIAIAVSTPGNPAYGQHLSNPSDFTAPDPAHLSRVRAWISTATHNVTLLGDGSTLAARMSVSAAERLFKTTISNVTNAATGQTAHRAGAYTLDDDLPVAAVFGLHGLPLPPRKRATASTATAPSIGPSDLRKAYSVSGVTASGSVKNRQAVAEFQGEEFNSDDLEQFFQNFVPDAPASDAKVYAVHGQQQEGAGIEASLDLEYIMGVAPGIKTEYYLQGQNPALKDFCADLVKWTALLLGTDDVPHVHSASYGWQGALQEFGCADSAADKVDGNFAKLAAKGVTVIFSSGDGGSGQRNGGGQLEPCWPAGSPWVTAVGATRFHNDDTGSSQEDAVDEEDGFGSGGGFSWRLHRPKWQSAAVEQYLKVADQLPNQDEAPWNRAKGVPIPSSFKARATPDVAALGTGFTTVVSGAQKIVGGTSAAAPTFAAIVSLLNEERITNGGKPLGFLNPFIYANPSAFNDVTTGSNKFGPGGSPLPDGFDCAEGWDPVTGWGTPNFPRLRKASMAAAGLRGGRSVEGAGATPVPLGSH